MFKILCLFASLFTSISAFDDEKTLWERFTSFQERFNKRYSTLEELETRFDIFRENLRNIIEHNLVANQNFTLGINQFTDLTHEEFKSQFTGGYKMNVDGYKMNVDGYKTDVDGYKTNVGSYGCTTFTSSASGAPVAIDWRKKNAVTSVKDQGQCGSCWTFSSTGASEGAWAIKTGTLVDLSEEQLVECATGMQYGSHGCNGGQMEGAFKYLIQNGQCADSAYPYTSGNGKSGSCKSCTPVAHFSSCSDVKPNDQISLKGAVSQQPVAVAIEADTRYFQSYSGGIMDSPSCGTSLDHGVLIVGYGEENGAKYWILKNSWSTSWGEQGYFRILRTDSTNDPGICGVAMDPSFISV
jgi:KDEL-tailed cysteine endopeptidase